MAKQGKIPVHRMDDWICGVYLKPFGTETAGKPYEISEPHRHDFYYVVLLDKGHLELEVDFQKMELNNSSVFLSYPGQVHQINSAKLEKGWFLAFDPALIDEPLRDILDQSLSEIIHLPQLPGTGLFILIERLYHIHAGQSQMFRQQITKSMVSAFIYELLSIYLLKEQSGLVKHSARSIALAKKFRQSLRRNFKTLKRPADYAERLNITVTYLNDTVRAVTGFPVTYHIQQELILEAQRLLAHSGLSIKEIAGELGFDDAKYFNRLFSKVTGGAPGAFRKKT